MQKTKNVLNNSKRKKKKVGINLRQKKLSELLHGEKLQNISVNCLHSFKTKNKLTSHEKVCVSI